MSRELKVAALAVVVGGMTCVAWAGPYPGGVGTPGTTAIHKDDPRFVAWASGHQDYVIGSPAPAARFQTPELALGKAVGDSFHVVSLGDGGSITLSFGGGRIVDGPGADFAVFENDSVGTFIELAWVDLSPDGLAWHRVPAHSLTAAPVPTFGTSDPTNIDGFASKYPQGWATPFDLADVGLAEARFVRLVDVIGDGRSVDVDGHAIYDPYPQTAGGVGFDLDAVGVVNFAAVPEPGLGMAAFLSSVWSFRRRRR